MDNILLCRGHPLHLLDITALRYLKNTSMEELSNSCPETTQNSSKHSVASLNDVLRKRIEYLLYRIEKRDSEDEKCRPLEPRIRLYDEVHRLRRLGLSYREIIIGIERHYSIRIQKSHVSEWLREVYNPRSSVEGLPEDIKPSEELAYIIGTIAGDGYVRIVKTKEGYIHFYSLQLTCKDADFAMEFARCLKAIGCKSCIRIRDGFYSVKKTFKDII